MVTGVNPLEAYGLMSVGVKVTVLVGGVGGARFLLGVQHLLGLGQFGGSLCLARGRSQLLRVHSSHRVCRVEFEHQPAR